MPTLAKRLAVVDRTQTLPTGNLVFNAVRMRKMTTTLAAFAPGTQVNTSCTRNIIRAKVSKLFTGIFAERRTIKYSQLPKLGIISRAEMNGLVAMVAMVVMVVMVVAGG